MSGFDDDFDGAIEALKEATDKVVALPGLAKRRRIRCAASATPC